MHGTGAVVHMGEHEHGQVVVQGTRNFIRFHQFERKALRLAQPFGDVEVSGKVAALAHDHATLRRILLGDRDRGRQHLVEVDGGGVGGHHLVLSCADQRSNQVAQALRQLEPASGVPRPDEVAAPLGCHHFGRTRCG